MKLLLVSILTLGCVTAISAAIVKRATDTVVEKYICGGTAAAADGTTTYTGTVSADKGVVMSTNYDDTYGATKTYNAYEECTLTITTTTAGIILTFNDPFSLEGNCANDYVQINYSDGDDKYCGSTVPTVAEITGKTVKVVFKSDSSVQKTGFKLSWKTKAEAAKETAVTETNICGDSAAKDVTYTGTTSATEGVVISPNYPANYFNGVTCTLTITTTAESTISLTFSNTMSKPFSIESTHDYVQISDATKEIGKYDGSARTAPTVADITGKKVTVVFHSDSSQTYEGFKLTWKATATGSTDACEDKCGTTVCGLLKADCANADADKAAAVKAACKKTCAVCT